MPVLLRPPTRTQQRWITTLAKLPDVARWTGAPGPNARVLAVLHWHSHAPTVPALVGFAHLDVVNDGARTLGAFDLAIAPEHRQRGLGLGTVWAAEAELRRSTSARQVALGVHAANTAGRALYARAGYRQAQDIAAPDGSAAYLLLKSLYD